jgi:zinc/manganese transport system substrate-binding protein
MLRRLYLLGLCLPLLLAACQSAAPSGKLRVVATHSLLGDWVQNVGGDAIDLTVLVPPGGDAHAFAPNAADGAALASAAVVFENGLGFEPWLNDLYSSSASKAARVVVTAGITPLTLGAERDPHVWHDVANVKQMVEAIRAALSQADPANAARYQANADAYTAQLQTLDQWVMSQVQTIPEARRKLVTTHDTFGYFAARYGFTVLGTILPTSTEGASPSAQSLAALVETVKAAGVPAVFAENVSSNALLNQVAAEAGVAVVATLYTDALGPPGSDGDTYLKLMRFNVTTIANALGGKTSP